MQMILIGILLLCGYFYLFQAIAKRTANRSALPVIAVLLLLIYGLVSVVLIYVLDKLGSTEMTMLSFLLLMAVTVVAVLLFGAVRSFRKLNKGFLLLFIVYLLGLAYMTLLSRGEANDTSIRMVPFASLTQARTKTTDMLNHMLLNVAMFVPVGILFPMIYPEKLAKWGIVLCVGLMLTVAIESTQLVFRLGQCDIDDIIANTAGALAGFLLFRIYQRFTRKPEEAEE